MARTRRKDVRVSQRSFRMLLLEDSPEDAQLTVAFLKRAEDALTYGWVESRSERRSSSRPTPAETPPKASSRKGEPCP